MTALHILALLGVLAIAAADDCHLGTPHGLQYLGVGYDILRGNPEGGDLTGGGVDPGLKVSRRVFKLTYEKGKRSTDRRYDIPDEAIFIHRSSAARSVSKKTFSGTSSYVDKLSTQVAVSAKSNLFFAKTKFGASYQYQQVDESTKESGYVYSSEEVVENLGHARLVTELAEAENYPLADEFVISVCNLPASYDEHQYMNFLKDWGTHVVTEVDVGTRRVKTYREKRSKIMSNVASRHTADVSISGSFKGTTVSLSTGVDKLLKEASSEDHLGEEFSSYTIGSRELKEPISCSLMGMNEVLEEMYWSLFSEYVDAGLCEATWPREAIHSNVITAMRNYAQYSRVGERGDETFNVTLAWPRGTYGLIGRNRPGVDHCPSTEHLTFAYGTRMQCTNDLGHNTCSPSLIAHMTDEVKPHTVTYPLCVKEVSDIEPDAVWDFGKGSYCILKKGDCPEGFTIAEIKFDDDDTQQYVLNAKSGTLPDGVFDDKDTTFHYCCRKDADVRQPIVLPIEKPFYLLANTANCQKVLGMDVTQEYISVDTDHYYKNNKQKGLHPFPGVLSFENIMITYCYYEKSQSVGKRELNELTGLTADANDRNFGSLRLLERMGL